MAQATEKNKSADAPQPPPLRLSRVFHAPRKIVFKAWSSADHVKRWFCPETFTIPDAKVQMHVGGAFDVCMRSPAGEEHWVRGTFIEVTPPRRLVIDMRCLDSTGEPLFRAYTEVVFQTRLAEHKSILCRPTRSSIPRKPGWLQARPRAGAARSISSRKRFCA